MEVSSIHGRFQPFHRGHLEYALAALDRSDRIIIGITQHNNESLRWSALDVAKHRSEPEANPFSYVERIEIIEAALTSEGIDKSRFSFIPFPIETPNELSQYLHRDVIVYTTVYDEWNESKINLLRREGYNVEILWKRSSKDFEGKQVRRLITEGRPEWRSMVPEGAIPIIEKLWLSKQTNI
ncbi:MAG: adenylyltransferase/cytidyltransferase family protein [Hoeflea sp.]|uniref:adenylyltransferase/cytidyltransferase family protein n=1 Tax=Hoeflea sp. TaxID=1940281 RepID=UPI0027311CDA|nr:adenylyltransferase/cytidyltransferase family protein [Hoeflea sp.]MDP2121069.1 adenylyltransferase/cytidyltransferase family protein [Hoeflea sp.]